MTNKRQMLLASLAGVSALVAGILTASRKSETTKSSELLKLWSLSLPTPSGAPLPLSQFKGKPLLINFWATWCAPCIEEIPLLDAFYQKNKLKSFQLLGIAADKEEAVNRFIVKTPIQFPLALAGFDGIALSQSLGNTTGGLPFTALLDANSAILFTKSGQLTTNDLSNITNLMFTPKR